MSLADVFERVKSGVFHIVFLDADNHRVGSGSAFATCGYLVTNHHVFSGPRDTRVWIRRETHQSPAEGILLSYAEFAKRLRAGLSTGTKRTAYNCLGTQPPVVKFVPGAIR
jgi:hypothetical protein